MASYVSHLECAYTGQRYEADGLHTISDAGKPLLVRYDLRRLGTEVRREDIESSSEPGFWRYSPLLPVGEPADRVSLGEVVTPLVSLERSAQSLGAVPGKVLVKDESRLPTGSFKARGLALAVSMAKQLGIGHLAVPTNGNAGSALAAYASRAGIRTTVLCPDNTPEINTQETKAQGGDTHLITASLESAAELSPRVRMKLAGSPYLLSRNLTELKERRPWESNWRSRWDGSCRMSSSTPQGEAQE